MPNPITATPTEEPDGRPVVTPGADDLDTAEQELARWLELQERVEVRAELAGHGPL